MKKRNKKLVSAFLGLMTAVSMFALPAFAAGKVETDKACTLEIQYQYEETALSNVEFELYYVADIDEYAKFTLAEAFSQYPVEIGEYSGSEWNELASTLDSYITRDGFKGTAPEPVDSGKTDENGAISFPNQMEKMEPGLYLLIGESRQRGEYRYICDPSMICIPGQDHEANEWVYDIDVFPKSDRKYNPDDDNPIVKTISRRVVKGWDDDGFEEERPDSISVTLLKDGEEFDSVTLSDDNNWSYTWTGLDEKAVWKVVEDVPDGYTVKITKNTNTFFVKNSKMPTEKITDQEPDDPRGVLSERDEYDPFGVLGAYDEDMPFGLLPQTGTTWWLAAALAGAGLLFFAMGLMIRRNQNG